MAVKKAKDDTETTHATQVEEPPSSQKHKGEEETELAATMEETFVASTPAVSDSSEKQVLNFTHVASSKRMPEAIRSLF